MLAARLHLLLFLPEQVLHRQDSSEVFQPRPLAGVFFVLQRLTKSSHQNKAPDDAGALVGWTRQQVSGGCLPGDVSCVGSVVTRHPARQTGLWGLFRPVHSSLDPQGWSTVGLPAGPAFAGEGSGSSVGGPRQSSWVCKWVAVMAKTPVCSVWLTERTYCPRNRGPERHRP